MEQLVTALLSVLGGAVGVKGIDALRERWKAGDVREQRDDTELAEVRREYRAQNDALLARVDRMAAELDRVKAELADTRVDLARSLAEQEVHQGMYTQLVQAHEETKRERDALRVDLATRNAEITDLRTQLGRARDELQVLKMLPALPAKGDEA